MLNLLIVEDNDLEREALKNYINWDLLGIRVADTAYNGQDGLEKTKIVKPDIIISDIKMPVMDGIMMAKAVKEIYPGTRFIFQSGYDDVALLKGAIELQVHDYIIKPVNPDELIKSVKKIATVLVDEKLDRLEANKFKGQYMENLPFLQEKFLESLVLKEWGRSDEILLFNQASSLKLRIPGNYKLALLHLDFVNTDILEISSKTELVLNVLKNTCMDEKAVIYKFEQNKMIILMHSLQTEADNTHILLRSVQTEIETLAGEYGFKYSIGLSAKAPNLTSLYSLFRQCWLSADKKTEMGYGCIIQYEDSVTGHTEGKNSYKDDIKGAIKKISDKVIAGDNAEDLGIEMVKALAATPDMKFDSYQSAFLGLFSYLSDSRANFNENLEKISEDKLNIFNNIINIKTIPDLVQYANETLKSLSSNFAKRKIDKDEYVINEIINILNNEYNRPITLSYLSDRVYLSPNYLRVLFKEKMNISIQDYLTDLRIAKAKDLLKHSRYKIHEIGEKVGYGSDTYFNIVFKNYVNITPGEYRSKYLFNEIKMNVKEGMMA